MATVISEPSLLINWLVDHIGQINNYAGYHFLVGFSLEALCCVFEQVVLFQPRQTGKNPNLIENLFEWDIKHQYKQTRAGPYIN